jgi:hypothetical protein
MQCVICDKELEAHKYPTVACPEHMDAFMYIKRGLMKTIDFNKTYYYQKRKEENQIKAAGRKAIKRATKCI